MNFGGRSTFPSRTRKDDQLEVGCGNAGSVDLVVSRSRAWRSGAWLVAGLAAQGAAAGGLPAGPGKQATKRVRWAGNVWHMCLEAAEGLHYCEAS